MTVQAPTPAKPGGRGWTFVVEQGLYSPRDKMVDFRYWSEHSTLSDAMREARRVGLSQIVQQRIIHRYEDGKLVRRKGEAKEEEGL